MITWVNIGLSASVLFGMAIILTYILGWASKAFHVHVDPRQEEVLEALPGANCGGCGHAGCSSFAAAVVEGEAEVTGCTAGGEACAEALAKIMGIEARDSFPTRPIVHCGATFDDRLQRVEYFGEKRCAAANLVTGVQGCIYGCLGFGDCQTACEFDSIHVIDGLATVDYDKCIGCGACARVCPRNIITITSFVADRMLAVTCSNQDPGPDVKRVCKVGCLGCKSCQRASNLFKIENNLSTINYGEYSPEELEKAVIASKRCARHRLAFVGKGDEVDIGNLPVEALTKAITADFKTTVDDTEWRG